MEDLLQVGVITTTHGIRGQVKVFPTTDDIRRFDDLKEVKMIAGKTEMDLTVEAVQYFKQFAILKFKGFDHINDIEKYKGAKLYVTRENAVSLEDNEYFVADLIGLSVICEDGQVLGTIRDVLSTGANDVYVVADGSRREIMLPAIKDCILSVSLEKQEMKVHLLDGLLD